ncbi:DHS-like NAD/FAD-binding domain-containing protein [Pseudovirgaria hyperparasitica]|uniref:DHS-like NAD/FAD-binding domain-containing protein n=1 Tax=Pseudovirgaria hyperparasitica TaxID=470096 RepID=A0A6A6WHG5_9PEZI|nr:DHS-like NAD/FAD-binding domain-containing protein [Pseudovirgaria hyperparasitica]KAF2761669.1 DHS-like NAD/FAD-binding domain-containing protein [Pseudovirgaria hyperparasitica]
MPATMAPSVAGSRTDVEVTTAPDSATIAAQKEHEAESDDEEDTFSDTGSEDDFVQKIHDSDDAWPFASEPNDETCTASEAHALRMRLRKVGHKQFIYETLFTTKMTVKKLCTAFAFDLPYNKRTADNYFRSLGHLIQRELGRRRALPQYKTIDHAANLLREKKNIIVITGAGISTSLGIPDFRSKTTGFYELLKEQGYYEPEEVFDLDDFDTNPSKFYNVAGGILPTLGYTSPTHAFVALLQKHHKLLTNYTQNIDNIESYANIEPSRLIQCHGSWATASCRKCGHKVKGEEIFGDVRLKRIARCQECQNNLALASAAKRKRRPNGQTKPKKRYALDSDSESDGQYDIPEPGVMKPDITFFGEQLPDIFFQRISLDRPEIDSKNGRIIEHSDEHQRQKRSDLNNEPYGPVDLVIVIGTSMKVAPVSDIPNYIPHEIPHILISREPVKHIEFDINLLGDCDPIVAELCRRAGLDLQHSMLNQNQAVDVQPYDEDHDNMFTVVVRKPRT